MAYEIKPNPKAKEGGYQLLCTQKGQTHAVNGIIFATRKAAETYLDRLTKLFEEKKVK